MKIIDFEKKGNVVKFYVGFDNCDDYYGDDWDDTPYESNAGTVYDEFVVGYFEKAFPFDDIVLEPSDCDYRGSHWCKDDMKDRKVPCICVLPQQYTEQYSSWDTDFNTISTNEKAIKYYFGDKVDESKEEIHYLRKVKNERVLLRFAFEDEDEIRRDIAARTFAAMISSGFMGWHGRINEDYSKKIENFTEKDYIKILGNVIKSVYKSYGADSETTKKAVSTVGVYIRNSRYGTKRIISNGKMEYEVVVDSGDEFEVGKFKKVW